MNQLYQTKFIKKSNKNGGMYPIYFTDGNIYLHGEDTGGAVNACKVCMVPKFDSITGLYNDYTFIRDMNSNVKLNSH